MAIPSPRRRRWFLALSPLLLVLAACAGTQGPGPKPPGDGTGTLADTTVVLDAAALDALVSAEADGTYVFAALSPALAKLEAGDVFIAGVSEKTPMGALRKVESVTEQGAGLSLETSQATLQQAFEDLDVKYDATLTASPAAVQSARSGLRPQVDGISFPLNLSVSGEHGQVELKGAVSLAPSFDLTLDLDIASFKLDALTMEFGASQTLLADLSGTGSVSFDKSLTLGTIPFTPIILSIPYPGGVIPLVLTPMVRVQAGLQGSASGNFQASVDQQSSFTAGLGYKGGSFGGFSDSDGSQQFDAPSYDAALNAKASIGPRLEVLLYGAVGPYASVDGFVAAGADLDGPPPCVRGVLNAGLTAKAGVSLLADYETTLFDKVYPLASFDSCSSDPDAPRPAITFARTFTRVGSYGEDARAVAQAADGSYLVVGNSSLFEGITGADASLWAMRLDPLGNVVWQRAYGGAFIGGSARAARAVADGFVIATRSGLMAIDAGGNVEWSKTFEGNGYLDIASLAVATDGGLLLAGRYGDSPAAWAAALSSTGDVRWSRTFAGDAFASVKNTDDGGFVLAGSRESGTGDGYLVKLDAAGKVMWQRALDDRYDLNGGEGDPIVQSAGDAGLDAVQKPDGSYVLVGYSYGAFPNPDPSPVGHYEAWVAELDAGGTLLSSTVHRAPATAVYDLGQAVVALQNGSVVTFGRRADNAPDLLSNEDVLMLKDGAYGVLGSSGNDTLSVDEGLTSGAAGVSLAGDGGIVLAMTSDSFSAQNGFWIVKLGRTARLSFPYAGGLAGTSHVNEEAVSTEVSAEPIDVSLTATATGPVRFESTAVTSAWQAP